ncbi:hypothetical protein MKW94_014585 [Papaver nudicaule]|uniref:Uncharacterized protein n=1 Tax=Papaver nudicaule TaxID=74823 RepID=A0AA41RVN4_PAPNU|nr:hypothetical protein [Papaver nudicaule]
MFLSRFQRLRNSKSRVVDTLVKEKVHKSWTACKETYFSTKETFENHKVVFTIATSIASVGTAWIGYSIRYMHHARVEKKLESIEKAMKDNKNIEQDELKKLVGYNVSLASCIATAGTTLVIGYALGWRGGRWFVNRKLDREKKKLKKLAMKASAPARWNPSLSNHLARLQPLRRQLRLPEKLKAGLQPLRRRLGLPEKLGKNSDALEDTAVTTISSKLHSLPK